MDTRKQSKPTDWIMALTLSIAMLLMAWEYRIYNREAIRHKWASHEYMVSLMERKAQQEAE